MDAWHRDIVHLTGVTGTQLPALACNPPPPNVVRQEFKQTIICPHLVRQELEQITIVLTWLGRS